MNENEFSWTLFNKVPLIGIVRNIDVGEMMQILPIYVEAGLTTIEITMNTPNAEDLIRDAVERYRSVLNVGAGTVSDIVVHFETLSLA